MKLYAYSASIQLCTLCDVVSDRVNGYFGIRCGRDRQDRGDTGENVETAY